MTGLANAPVTKGCLFALCACTFVAGAFSRKYYFNVPLSPHLSRDHQFWRLVTHHLAFANTTELFLSVLIIFNLAVIVERIFGSIKFASFLAVCALFTTILEVLCLLLLHGLGFKSIPAGPFGLVCGLVYQYHRVVPSSYQFRLGSVTFNNKVFTYFLVAQLLISQSITSALPCACGLIAGALYRADTFGLRSYRLPKPFVSLMVKLLQPVLGSPATQRGAGLRRGTYASVGDAPTPAGFSWAFSGIAAGTATRRGNAAGPTAVAPTAAGRARPALAEWAEAFAGTANARQPPAPSQEQVATLQAMFPDATPAAITQALTANANDVNRAVERLLAAG